MLKYSELKEKINIKPLKDIENEQAYVTHYFHNFEHGSALYFQEPAIKYLTNYDIDGQIEFSMGYSISTSAKP